MSNLFQRPFLLYGNSLSLLGGGHWDPSQMARPEACKPPSPSCCPPCTCICHTQRAQAFTLPPPTLQAQALGPQRSGWESWSQCPRSGPFLLKRSTPSYGGAGPESHRERFCGARKAVSRYSPMLKIPQVAPR